MTRKIDIPDWVDALLKPTKIGSWHLQRQWEEIGDEVLEAAKKVLPAGKYTLGPYLKKFEEEFAEFSDSKYAIGVSSGTKALHIVLEAMGIEPVMRLLQSAIPMLQPHLPLLIAALSAAMKNTIGLPCSHASSMTNNWIFITTGVWFVQFWLI